ncbi:PREDICTED: GRAM domain-containing protein 2-like isoform X3 [Nicrophorus vespilloides]|uniref:GRAM domain-containing protein 2-like isoform X3 n=1 Tax=Nicrophorus vespilloides TaxID=110193 RepID=A0ABM1NJP1_NICVS|nr:PREDICTED: GRAM domain-containing protein 2-like isoform X3 [Nicrophorus vespilloides]
MFKKRSDSIRIPSHIPLRSSGNFGSAGARSAPSTPQGILCSSPGALSDSQSGISPPCSLPRSPSHNIFTKYDSKRNIKHLSCSTPVMTAQAQSPEPPSPKASSSKDGKQSAYKGRQKKFIRHFPSASEDTVLNYYSCALIGDILLQGHLYITQNYFAFYSNVFGYVTKLLIPMQSVRKISKEKTARIIPNAVGITTTEDKHVFGSLMSRDNTYKFMNEIWDTAKKLQDVALEPPEPIVDPSDESDSSETPPESGRESDIGMPKFRTCVKSPDSFSSSYTRLDGKSSDAHGGGDHSSPSKDKHFRVTTVPNVLLVVTTLVLVMLFLSAALLLYRIGRVQTKYSQALQENFVITESEDVYGELLQWQTHLHSKSAGAVHSFLDTNLDQIAKVRQSLEALSTLLVPNSSGTTAQKSAAKPVESPENS